MNNLKHNKNTTRAIVVSVALAAGLGIWGLIHQAPVKYAAAVDNPGLNTSQSNSTFSQTDTFLTPAGVSSGTTNGQRSSAANSASTSGARLRTRAS